MPYARVVTRWGRGGGQLVQAAHDTAGSNQLPQSGHEADDEHGPQQEEQQGEWEWGKDPAEDRQRGERYGERVVQGRDRHQRRREQGYQYDRQPEERGQTRAAIRSAER